MDAKQLWFWLFATLALTIGALIIAATRQNQPLAILAGAMFAVVAAIVGWRFAGMASAGETPASVSARFARLISTAWGWGGVAMLATYYLTDLSWQHAWQYGMVMLVIAGGIYWYGSLQDQAHPAVSSQRIVFVARILTMFQGVAALGAVAVLALSGKLQPESRDWAANVIFVAGGLTIFSLSMAALRAERRAGQRTGDT